MTNKEFRKFKETIKQVSEQHPIWWAGYLFFDLSEAQAQEIRKVLISRGFRTEGNTVYTPSGIGTRG